MIVSITLTLLPLGFSGGSVTLGGMSPSLKLSNQKDTNNQTWHKYSLSTYKHFDIKI